MNSESLLDRLSRHRVLAAAPPNQIQWVARHGVQRTLLPGDILTPKQGRVTGLHIVLSGHLTIYVDQGSGPRKVMEWRDEIGRAHV